MILYMCSVVLISVVLCYVMFCHVLLHSENMFVICDLWLCFMTCCNIMQWIFAFLLDNLCSLLFYNAGLKLCFIYFVMMLHHIGLSLL